ncbi:MAG: Rap1a/Tai family immunity protein [Pontixanthobacter sp.]
MLRFIAFAIAVFIAQLPAAGSASFIDGSTLLEKCESRENSATYYQDRSFCMAYVLGAIDQLSLNTTADKDFVYQICLRESVTSGQLRDVVVKYLRENPADRDSQASFAVWISVRKAWPCSWDNKN